MLNERAAKEAADRAAKEQAEKDAPAPRRGPDATSPASSGFMDTRLAFTLTNENLLVKPGETIPSVPGWRFGTPNSLGVLFFDNYDTRYSRLRDAVARGRCTATITRVTSTPRARSSSASTSSSEKNIALSDAGTYITLSNWKDPTHKDPTRISLTAFPVSSDRMRLGYSYRLSWGGSPEYRRATSADAGHQAPVRHRERVRVRRREERASCSTAAPPRSRPALAFLAGAGIDPTDMVRVEVNGGYFDRGYNELSDVNDQKVQLFGASAQVALHKGMPVQSSVDYKLYKNNNERVSGLFNPVKYPGGLSWLAMAEFTALGQTLKDPEKTGLDQGPEGLRRRRQRPREDRPHPRSASTPATATSRSSCTRQPSLPTVLGLPGRLQDRAGPLRRGRRRPATGTTS